MTEMVQNFIQRMNEETSLEGWTRLMREFSADIKAHRIQLTQEDCEGLGILMKALPRDPAGIMLWNILTGSSIENASRFHSQVVSHFFGNAGKTNATLKLLRDKAKR